jgi:hypothetical protein
MTPFRNSLEAYDSAIKKILAHLKMRRDYGFGPVCRQSEGVSSDGRRKSAPRVT